MVSEINRQTIREHILESLSWVRDLDRAAVDADVEAHGGDVRIDSKEGEAICVLVEDALELGELVQACDLQPEQVSSLSALTQLFERRVADHAADHAKDAA